MPVERPLASHEIVTLAVLLVGGDVQYADTEDVAIKANELAPGRFTWHKYADQINIELIRVYLSDAKKPKVGGWLTGSVRQGWRLTEQGLQFARANLPRLDGARKGRQRPLTPEQQRERDRMLSSEAFASFRRGGLADVSRRQAEAFFRVDDYVTGEARRRKVERVLTWFGPDPRLGPAIRELADKIITD